MSVLPFLLISQSGKGKGKGKGYGCSSKSSKGGSGKGGGKGGSKGSKGGKGRGGYRHRFAPPPPNADGLAAADATFIEEPTPQQRQRGLRGEDDQDAAAREVDPGLQGIAAAIAAHQQREVRQQRKRLKRRRNRTPEEKARDRALASPQQR